MAVVAEGRSPALPDGDRRAARGRHPLGLAIAFLTATGLLTVGAARLQDSPGLFFALVASFVALACLGFSVRRYGLLSLGGITLGMVAILFIGRWFFPPVSSSLLTPRAIASYDREGALLASATMISFFALAYALGNRRVRRQVDTDSAEGARTASGSGSTVDLVAISLALVVVRLLSGEYLDIGIAGRPPAAVPLVGVIYFASSLGPLAGAALILAFGQGRRSSRIAASIVLLALVVVESSLGSHGTAFNAIIVYSGALALVGAPLKLTVGRALLVGLIVAAIVSMALLMAFVARTERLGGTRRTLVEVPAFLVNRLGGIEYIAPAIGAVDRTGSDLQNLRATTWGLYVTTEVYGLPAKAQTGFATTAVGWWYGLGRLTGVAIGGAVSGLLASLFDRWSHGHRLRSRRGSATFLLGVWLAWATFLLGGTVGSLGGIAVGFSGMAFSLAMAHRWIVGSRGPTRLPETQWLAPARSRLAPGALPNGGVGRQPGGDG